MSTTDTPRDDDVGDLVNSVPGCFIVSSRRQSEGMMAFASVLANEGITRRVFPESQIDVAKQWAKRKAAQLAAIKLSGAMAPDATRRAECAPVHSGRKLPANWQVFVNPNPPRLRQNA